jgi:hypothetical protein
VSALWSTTVLASLVFSQAPHPGVPASAAVVPAGTSIAVRFRQTLEGGRSRVGSPVDAQTMAPLALGRCSVVPPFMPVAGTVVVSRGGALFDRGGHLGLRFDSIAVRPGVWVRLHASLDSLEWLSPSKVGRKGALTAGARSLGKMVRAAGLAGLAGAVIEVGMIPAAAVLGLDVLLRGGPARILAGQHATLRLTAPLVVPAPAACAITVASASAPQLPPLPPRTSDREGTAGRDPINLVLLGTRADVDSAFRRADWIAAEPSRFGTLAREAEAIVLAQRDSAAPMSHLYYLGRREDVRFERASPSARVRHHVRLWQADTTGTMWAAAATEDIGYLVSARHRAMTHRVARDVDRERDLLVRDLLAGGCAALDGYASLPGADSTGTTVAGQRYVTDARVAVVSVTRCGPIAAAREPVR